jgi:hypothetical protein
MIHLAKFFGSMLVLLVMCSSVLSMPKAYSTLQFEDGEVKVDVYVIVLDGVEVRDVDNVTKVVDGAREAVETVNENNFTVDLPFSRIWVNVSSHFFRKGSLFEGTWYVHFRIPVNASFHVVTEWDVYESVVESSRECVVVNAHGAVVPIPEGYSKEAWVDKIAEAMLYRNVTWVHVGGYPFYYFQRQGSTMETWGDDGLKKLMANIGKPNVTCTKSEYERSIVNGFFEILDDTWFITMAFKVPRTWPLNSSDFGWLAFPIWGYYHPDYEGSYPLAGAAIAFKRSLNETSFGYYVHIGTNGTFSEGGDETDKDFWRAHHGCATGLYCLLARTSGEIMLSEAQQSIEKASSEGRTSGLDEALHYFDEAKSFNQYFGGSYEFWDRIYRCMVAAVNAEKPSSNSDMDVAILIVLALGVAVSTGVYWKKRSGENDKEEKQSDD